MTTLCIAQRNVCNSILISWTLPPPPEMCSKMAADLLFVEIVT